jgi:DNA topoisomerase IA
MKTLIIIVEKPSQARNLRAAIGSRFGEILPAEGHVIRLAEPDEVNAGWKRWSCELLKPEGLYPTRAAREQIKSAKLNAIAAALKGCDGVILATDCDREPAVVSTHSGDDPLRKKRLWTYHQTRPSRSSIAPSPGAGETMDGSSRIRDQGPFDRHGHYRIGSKLPFMLTY